MKTLTAQKILPNFTRWTVDDFTPNDKAGHAYITVVVSTPVATNYQVRSRQILITNGRSDRVDYAATVGGEIKDNLTVAQLAVATPTGYTDAMNAFRGGATPQARRDALETWMLTAGVAGPGLAGT